MAANDRDLNRDPITDEPGSHPVGTGVGATGGALAGAAAGALGGPIGAAVGGVVGAVVGGLAGKAAAEAINPTEEEAFWRENYTREPYYESGRSFDDYGPAYRLGLSARTRYEDPWTSVEPRLASEWDSTRGNSTLNWDRATHASRAAWTRTDEKIRNYRAPTGTVGDSGASGSTGTMGSSAGAHAGSGARAAAMVGGLQQAGDSSGSRSDVVDTLRDLVECCKDGEYGFRQCAEQLKREDLRSTLLQHAEQCRKAADELNGLIRECGGQPEDDGSTLGAVHRGWVSVKATLSSYDDKAVMAECERGEDNAKARYRKALDKALPDAIRAVVQRQLQGVERNHDHVKMLRDSL